MVTDSPSSRKVRRWASIYRSAIALWSSCRPLISCPDPRAERARKRVSASNSASITVVISSISKFTLGAANNNYATRRITLFDSRTGARLQSIDHHDGSGQVVPHFDGAGFDLVANGHGPQDASCCTTALAVTRFRWDGASFKELTTVRMQIPYK